MLVSQRLGLNIVMTAHAQSRAAERGISLTMIQAIVDTGEMLEAKPGHLWFFKSFTDRTDNLLCVAAVVENVLVVKTVLHHWRPAP